MKLHTVLRPPQNTEKAATDFAQRHFSQNNMGYCIGSDGHLPHITLLQTEVPDEAIAKALFNAISALSWGVENELTFGDYYHNTDKPYCGLDVINTDFLQSLHEQALSIHHDMNVPVLNVFGEGFWPHMTFAKSETRLENLVNLPLELKSSTNGWTLEFGHTGEHGVYLGAFKPK